MAAEPEAGSAALSRLAARKTRDRAIALVTVGTALLMPPLAQGAAFRAAFFGVPLPVLYVFGVWAGLILGAALLARPLRTGGGRGPGC